MMNKIKPYKDHSIVFNNLEMKRNKFKLTRFDIVTSSRLIRKLTKPLTIDYVTSQYLVDNIIDGGVPKKG